MSDLFEKINANAEAAKQEEQKRKETARKARQADRRMSIVLASVVGFWILIAVLASYDHVSKALADFLSTWAGIVLAIWFGAWFQFRFCGKGLMR